MDFGLSEHHKMLRQTVRDFATNEIEPLAAEIDENEKFPAGIVAKMADIDEGLLIKAHEATGIAIGADIDADAFSALSKKFNELFDLSNEPSDETAGDVKRDF